MMWSPFCTSYLSSPSSSQSASLMRTRMPGRLVHHVSGAETAVVVEHTQYYPTRITPYADPS